MLRLLVLLLALANLLAYTYFNGHLRSFGLGPVESREPLRLQGQLRPERLTVLAPDAPLPSPTPEAPTPAPDTGVATAPDGRTACWQAGGYSSAQLPALRAALTADAALAGLWTVEESVLPERWIVFLGRFANAEALQRRRAELRQAQIDNREVTLPDGGVGLAIGTYSTEAAAQQALQQATRRGIAGATVRRERPESRNHTLRLPAITEAQRERVQQLGPALAGRELQACG